MSLLSNNLVAVTVSKHVVEETAERRHARLPEVLVEGVLEALHPDPGRGDREACVGSRKEP